MLVGLLDGTICAGTSPLLRVDDLGVARGDGIFETVLAVDRQPRELDAHLARMTRSASMLDLPAPDLPGWRRAVRAVTEAWSGNREIVLKLIMTRGVPAASGAQADPTCFVTGSELPAPIRDARRDGVRVVTLNRGIEPALGALAPWLLMGAKTLSYAVNMAALREAERRGADDAIFVSPTGRVLEGATSTVITARAGNRPTLRTPPPIGILPGTTQQALFRAARAAGWETVVEPLTIDDLYSADAVWLVSAIRLAARLRELDGVRLEDRMGSREILELLDAPVGDAADETERSLRR